MVVVTQYFKSSHNLQFNHSAIQHINIVRSMCFLWQYISFCSNATPAFNIKGFAMNVTARQSGPSRATALHYQLAAAYITTDHM